LCYTAFVLWHLGCPEQALQKSYAALQRAQQLRLPYMHAFALNCAARLHQLCGDTEGVRKHATAALQIATIQGFASMREMGRVYLGWVLVQEGKGEEGIAQIHQGMTAYRATGGEAFRTYYLALLAEAYGSIGQHEAGLHTITEALTMVRRAGGRYYEAELYRLKGELTLQKFSVASSQLLVPNPKSFIPNTQHLTPGTRAEAEECFRHAIAIARRQRAKSLELRATMSLSRLWQQQGKKRQAYQMLAKIYGWFTESFETADLQAARALLEALAREVKR
jgi:predicted ATPase